MKVFKGELTVTIGCELIKKPLNKPVIHKHPVEKKPVNFVWAIIFCPPAQIVDPVNPTPDPGFFTGFNPVKSALFTGSQNFTPCERPVNT